MKSSAPWSVKGVERDARETAKEAARREGMTVGEWLNQVIYTASDPASSNGQIEGLKISDLVNAIEHVSKRVIGGENRNSDAFEELSRNLAGFVERVQRLERARPAQGGAEFEERLRRVEERSGDRGRIEALKALEKAVGQVAQQFDTAQRGVSTRFDSLERQIQQFAGRIDAISESAQAAGAIDHLKNMCDAMSVRLSRVERTAAEAQKRPAEPAPQGDPEFVERTGAKLRVLGDEIKRGGDQIRGLEAAIKKLAVQIDAAERRSSEGVQKVAETISELKSQFSDSENQKAADPRADIEAAIAESAQRTEDRINQLQRSFEAILDRLEQTKSVDRPALGAPSAASAVVAAAAAEPAASAPGANPLRPAPPAPVAAEADDEARRAEIEEALSAFDLDYPESEPTRAEADDPDFDLGGDADAGAPPDGLGPPNAPGEGSVGAAVLADVRAAFGETSPSPSASRADAPAAVADDIDFILAELEGIGESAGPVATETQSAAALKPAAPNYLQEARRAAKEAAEKAAAESAEAASRRKLTPKQRAILAAKIKRKRLAAEQAAAAAAPPVEAAAPIAEPRGPAAPEGAGGSPSLIGGALAAFRKLKAAKAPKSQTAEAAADSGESFRTAGAAKKAKPLTLALGAALILAVGALVFPLKDLVFGNKPKASEKAPTPRQEPAAGPTAAPEAVAPEVPSPPVVKPRALYLDSVAKLKSAKSDADTREALKGLQEAAALGHPPAQLQLGELYKLGQGVAQDAAQARAWYERAANGGNVLAMHRLGVMSARGQGGAVDQTLAIRWFETAAKLGLVDSQYNLGAIYHPGGDASAGVQDAGKAYFWYSIAAQNGDTQAGELAVGLASGFTGERKRQLDAEAAAWAAATPDPDANEIAPAS